MEYTSKGQGALNTVLGAIGTAGATGILGNGGINLFGNNNCAAPAYTRYDAEKDAKIANLEMAVALRDANTYTDSKILALYEKMDARFNIVEREICDQRTYNAVNTTTISCIQGQVATLLGLTKTVIPNGSICPGWGNVTVAPATTTTA